MLTFKKILIPFDDQAVSKGALTYAAMIASQTGATITALFLADPKDYQSKSDFDQFLKTMVDEQIKPKLEEVKLSYPKIGKVDLQVRGLTKPVYRHVLDYAKENQIDFIVTRSHGQPKTEDWEDHLNATNAYKVVLEAMCPVFTFTTIPTSPRLKNILVPLDLSEGSLYKMPLAIELAKQFGSAIHLLSSSLDHTEHEDLQLQLQEVSAELKKRNIETVTYPIEKIELSDAILHHTDKGQVDLVTIMSRPSFRWTDLWLSPLAKQVLANSKVPILSVRSNKPLEIGL
ncbi:universal stress protein [Reichenbachiella sp.]